MKQSKLRRRRVFRYAVLYFVLLVVFVALIVGPIVAGKQIPKSVLSSLTSTNLIQPTGLNNDDTLSRTQTGTGSPTYSFSTSADSQASATASASSS